MSDWRERAACRGEDPELFFPIGSTGAAALQIEEAKAVCFRRPALEPCLEWALENRMEDGVWGGLSEDERRAMLRRRSGGRAEPAPERVRPVAPRCGTLRGWRWHIDRGETPCQDCQWAHDDDRNVVIGTVTVYRREIQTLAALAEGATVREIATERHITVKSVQGYLVRLRRILGVGTDDELVAAARAAGLLRAARQAVGV